MNRLYTAYFAFFFSLIFKDRAYFPIDGRPIHISVLGYTKIQILEIKMDFYSKIIFVIVH